MAKIGPPLGFSEIELPPAPSCGVELIAVYFVKLPIKGLKLSADYAFRGPKYVYKDLASYDEHMRYEFKISNKAIDYRRILHDDFMKVIAAFGAYRAEVAYDLYGLAYQGGTQDENPVYNKLLQDDSVDVDGRNNIFTLHPAQFWDLELCRRALGYGPEEVIARLKGICRLAIPLLDGVYIVLNDDPEMSYEEYVEMNNTIKPILGLL